MFTGVFRSKCHSVGLATFFAFVLRVSHALIIAARHCAGVFDFAAARHCSAVLRLAAPVPRLPSALKYFRTPGVTVTFSTGIHLTIRNRCDTCQDKTDEEDND